MKILFSQHALQQMFSRDISIGDVRDAIKFGEVINEYVNDKPYPSRLLLYTNKKVPLHVVYARNDQDNELIVITAYRPDVKLWETDFKTKKK
jgi:hypothetical protein